MIESEHLKLAVQIDLLQKELQENEGNETIINSIENLANKMAIANELLLVDISNLKRFKK